jgi:fluoroacetyl-CoA thioesterase
LERHAIGLAGGGMRRMRGGERAAWRVTVSDGDAARFPGGVVHRGVYGTAALVRDMEYAARLVLLPLLEDGEEGVGAEVWCRHLAPALVGDVIELVATAVEQTERKLVCDVDATAGGELVARGRITQVLVPAGRFPPSR